MHVRIGMIGYGPSNGPVPTDLLVTGGIETDCSYQVKLSVGPMDVMVKGTKNGMYYADARMFNKRQMGAYRPIPPFLHLNDPVIVTSTLIIQVNVPGSCCLPLKVPFQPWEDLWFRKSPGHTGYTPGTIRLT